MFERYTERARRVIFFARYEASQLGSNSIETEHLLLGLIREGKGLTSRIFSKSHLSMESIRKEIEGRALYRDKVSTSVDIPLSSESKRVLGYASEEAERMLHNYIGTEHILLGLMREEKSVAAGILGEKGMRLTSVREDIVQLLNEKANVGKTKETPLLSEFSRDLTEAAARGALDPLVGRDEELARIVQVLCRRTRNNPVLIGEPGVGKTALVEGLANKIVQGDVPVYLAEKRILALDISLIVAGTKYRGQFEERLKTIMRELTESHNIIIFIDELHTLVGAGSAEGSLDAANILKPALSRGEIQCIGATTPAEYRKYIEKDRSLERRFQAVKVASPTEEETIQILRGIKDRYEKFHHVELPRRGPGGRGLPVQPLHHRPLPPRQGHRPPGRGGQPREAARRRRPRGHAGVLAQDPRGGGPERPRRGVDLLPRRRGRPAREPADRPRALGHGRARAPTT